MMMLASTPQFTFFFFFFCSKGAFLVSYPDPVRIWRHGRSALKSLGIGLVPLLETAASGYQMKKDINLESGESVLLNIKTKLFLTKDWSYERCDSRSSFSIERDDHQ